MTTTTEVPVQILEPLVVYRTPQPVADTGSDLSWLVGLGATVIVLWLVAFIAFMVWWQGAHKRMLADSELVEDEPRLTVATGVAPYDSEGRYL